jgi:hypothetical protein
MPVESPDYKEIFEFNKKLHSKINYQGKDLIIGATYKFKDNIDRVYMGKFQKSNKEDKEVNEYFFREDSYYKDNDYFRSFKSLSGQIIDIIDEVCVENYADLMDKLIKTNNISERDQKKDKYVPYILEQFKEHLKNCYYEEHFYNEKGVKYFVTKYRNYWYGYNNYIPKYDVFNCERNRRDERIDTEITIERIFEKYKPHYLVTYKSNGELIKEWRD